MKKLVLPFYLVCLLRILPTWVDASITNILSDATWRATSPEPIAGWHTDIAFDDSDAAGWEYAFKSPHDAKIWIDSNQSSESPNRAWFRKVFSLPAKPTSASGIFTFDDDGEA